MTDRTKKLQRLVIGVPEIMGLVASLAKKMGVQGINKLPGPWVHVVDERWVLAVNATKETIQCQPDGTMGADIGPFGMAFWWNGWWAGEINANTESHGWFASYPDGANEDRLIADLKKAIAA